ADGTMVGDIEWRYFPGDNRLFITRVDVLEEYRRLGIAADLVQQLRDNFPEAQIDPGVMSEEGAALLRGPDPSIPLHKEDEAIYPYRLKSIRVRDMMERLAKYGGGKFELPKSQKGGMKVPKGGSFCAKY